MQKKVAACLLGGLALCAARFADLALWTDRATGLVTAGPVWARYAILFAFVGAALAAGHFAAGSAAPLRTPPRAAACALSVPAFAGSVLFVAQGVLDILRAVAVEDIARGALYLLCALWLECLGQGWLVGGVLRAGKKAAPPPAWLGVAGSLTFAWGILDSFMANGSSWHRTVPTSEPWQALAALLFLTAVLRAACLPAAAEARAICRYGLLAWILCLCWQAPRCILLPAQAADWGLAAVGALGGACAAACARPAQRGRAGAG